MSNSQATEFVCPAGLAMALVWREVAGLARRGPDPELARHVLQLAREVELRTGDGDASAAVSWLAGYLLACATAST